MEDNTYFSGEAASDNLSPPGTLAAERILNMHTQIKLFIPLSTQYWKNIAQVPDFPSFGPFNFHVKGSYKTVLHTL